MMNINDSSQNSLSNSASQLQNSGSQNGNLKNSAKSSAQNTSYAQMNYETVSTSQENTAANTSFKDVIEGAVLVENTEITDVSDILKDMDLEESYNYNTLNIDRQDAAFFVNMLNSNGLTNYSISNGGAIFDSVSMKSVEVSKTLNTLLTSAYESNKAVRLDFDNNVTVVLRLNNEGKLNAQFFPGDKAVEEYLRNNIPFLRQRFDEQNLSYANISYKPYKEHQENNNQQQESKENKNE